MDGWVGRRIDLNRIMWSDLSPNIPLHPPRQNHNSWSVGIAGRPGGPDWYFNLVRACVRA